MQMASRVLCEPLVQAVGAGRWEMMDPASISAGRSLGTILHPWSNSGTVTGGALPVALLVSFAKESWTTLGQTMI